VLASTYLHTIKPTSILLATVKMSDLAASPTDPYAAYVAPGKRRAHKLARDTASDLNFSTSPTKKTFDPRRFEDDPDEVDVDVLYAHEEKLKRKAKKQHEQTNGVTHKDDADILKSASTIDNHLNNTEPKKTVDRDPKYKQDLHEWRAVKKERSGVCKCAWHSDSGEENGAGFDQCLYQMVPNGYKPNPDAIVSKMDGTVRRILFQREFRFTLDWEGAGKHV
jgi:hypothetical protein